MRIGTERSADHRCSDAGNGSYFGSFKGKEGGDHPDRDAQFRYINTQVKGALESGMPIISVDTKKKELIGNYVNRGQQRYPKKTPRRVNGHDFPDPSVPRAHLWHL